jgi:hypothetical protein
MGGVAVGDICDKYGKMEAGQRLQRDKEESLLTSK